MTGDRLRLGAALAEALLEHARSELPNEACGLLSGDRAAGRATAFHPARNVLASPLRYEVHPEDLVRIILGIEADGRDLVAIFHSHTRTPPVPSASDLRSAGYPRALHLIASLADAAVLRAWRIGEGRADEATLMVE